MGMPEHKLSVRSTFCPLQQLEFLTQVSIYIYTNWVIFVVTQSVRCGLGRTTHHRGSC